MSNVSYDLDTSGGLMPLIQALIKPPDEEASTHKTKKPQHPYYKRPGKGHNHDCCDACGEGGDLICCDRCPASFHLGCYDPPLDESDIPAGLWLCKQCRGSDAEQPSSSRSSRAHSPADRPDTDRKSKSLRKKPKEEKEKGEDENEEKLEKASNPMEVLVKAAKIMNPKQFELPREMQVPCIFPGTEKEGGKSGGATVYTREAGGGVPARSCHVCAAGCRRAPLLQCDYCPLLFHQDCLDPPLTALPTGRWMCPNHVEQYIDWKLVNSVSMTDRVALWDQFSGPVDQHAIKVDFIRRARGNRPFRMKVPVGVRSRVVVPEMVRAHYRRPPPLLPSRREFVRCANVLRELQASGAYDESEEEGGAGARAHQICLNLACPQYSGAGPCPMDVDVDMDEDDESDEHAGHTRGATRDDSEEASGSSTDESDSDEDVLTATKEGFTEGAEGRPQLRLRLRLREGKALDRLLALVDEDLKGLDPGTIKVLAYQMVQQIAVGEALAGGWRRSRAGTWAARAHAAVGPGERAALQRLGVRLLQPPSALLPPAERRRIARAVWGPAPAAAPSAAPAPAAPARSPADRLADSLVRAALCPVQGGRGRRGHAGRAGAHARSHLPRGHAGLQRPRAVLRRLPPRLQHARAHLLRPGERALRADQLLGVGHVRQRHAVRVRHGAAHGARSRRCPRRPARGRGRRAARPRAARQQAAVGALPLPGTRAGHGGRVGGRRAAAARRAAAVRLSAVRLQRAGRARAARPALGPGTTRRPRDNAQTELAQRCNRQREALKRQPSMCSMNITKLSCIL